MAGQLSAVDVARRLPATVRRHVARDGQIWFYVPGHDMVPWTVEQITSHAAYLFDLHSQVHRRVIVWPRGFGRLPMLMINRSTCAVCRTSWMCRHGQWARIWLQAVRAR